MNAAGGESTPLFLPRTGSENYKASCCPHWFLLVAVVNYRIFAYDLVSEHFSIGSVCAPEALYSREKILVADNCLRRETNCSLMYAMATDKSMWSEIIGLRGQLTTTTTTINRKKTMKLKADELIGSNQI